MPTDDTAPAAKAPASASDTTTAPAAKAPPAVTHRDTEAALKGQIAALTEQLRDTKAQLASAQDLIDEMESARKSAARAAKDKKAEAPREPRALMTILGDGRKVFEVGATLPSSTLAGLTEGVHYELTV